MLVSPAVHNVLSLQDSVILVIIVLDLNLRCTSFFTSFANIFCTMFVARLVKDAAVQINPRQLITHKFHSHNRGHT